MSTVIEFPGIDLTPDNQEEPEDLGFVVVFPDISNDGRQALSAVAVAGYETMPNGGLMTFERNMAGDMVPAIMFGPAGYMNLGHFPNRATAERQADLFNRNMQAVFAAEDDSATG